jgi:hypothetical protein
MQRWFRIALINFFLAAVMGAIMRLAFVVEISWLNFRPFLHGHSHVAMLGWVYLGLFCLLIHRFIDTPRKIYHRLFWATQLSIVGMLIAFPLQGYGSVSITFSTLHILLSYVFTWNLWKDLDRGSADPAAKLFVRAGLLFMVISTLALWGLGPIMALDLSHQPIYYMLVQAFLHFQFNGWYVFAVLGILLHFMRSVGIPLNPRQLRWFFWLLAISCLLTYALAVTWSDPRDFLFMINSFGAAIQLVALVVFIRILYPIRRVLLGKIGGKWPGRLIKLGLLCFGLKILIQTAVIIPFLATIAYTIRNFVMGFLHLILLGLMSHLLLGFASRAGFISFNRRVGRAGLWVFVGGFILSELVLFLQGLLLWLRVGFLPFYYEGLFVVSALIPVGILLLLLGTRKRVTT